MMSTAYAVEPVIVVDGLRFDEEIEGYVEHVVVDEHVHLPPMFAITLHDPARDILDRSGMRIGSEIEISVAGQGADEGEVVLLKGDVVAIECDYDELGARVVARGYAKSHRLHRGRHTRTFLNSTDGEIVERVAKEAGIELGIIQSPAQVYEHVTQANISDWEFLSSRARAIGYEIAIVDDRLEFGLPSHSTSAPEPTDADFEGARDARQLTFGENLVSFHGRLSAAEQVGQVEVRAWDVARKEPIVASAPAGTVTAKLDLADPETLAEFFGQPTFVAVDGTMKESGEAEALAKALAERIGSGFAEADGVAIGHSLLRAGTPVVVTEVGEDFSGKYVLTHARHVFDRDGYRTHFTISGRHDRSLLGLVSSPTNGSVPAATTRNSMPGLVRAIVDEAVDPDRLGRVRVRLPWLSDEFSSAWAPVMQLGAGPESGTFFLPTVGDEVLVGFEHGDINRPIVVGGLFNGVDRPPEYGFMLDNGSVVRRGIYSRHGHHLLFSDTQDSSGVGLSTAKGDVNVGLNADEQRLYLQSDRIVEIVSLGSLKISAEKIHIEASGEMVLKAAQIKLN